MIVRRILLTLLCLIIASSFMPLEAAYAYQKSQHAVGVIERQTLLSTPNWTVESNQTWAHLGWSVGTAGDVNGDGFADVIVGVPYYGNGQIDEGCVYVYLGSAGGLDTTPAWMVEGNLPNINLGTSVGTAGDVNGDGYSDVIIGAPYYDTGGDDPVNRGRAYVYLGSASGLGATPAWSVEGNQSYEWLGCSVGAAGDVNGDGYSDIVVGAPDNDALPMNEGRAYVYLGTAGGVSATPDWIGEDNQEYSYFGYSVSTAGDVNGDGYSDVVVGAPRAHYEAAASFPGCAYVYFGSASGLNATPGWTVEGDQSYAWFGCAVGIAGDINDDGYSDIAVGAYAYDGEGNDEGSAYVYLGSSNNLSTIPIWAAEGNQQNAWFGWSVGTAGDVNGDGYSDVIVGEHLYDVSELGGEGRTCVYHGSASGLSASPDWTMEGDKEGVFFGFSVGTAGDVNNDGYSDVIVGAYNYDNGEAGEGCAYVYLGSSIIPTPTLTPIPTATPTPTLTPTPSPSSTPWPTPAFTPTPTPTPTPSPTPVFIPTPTPIQTPTPTPPSTPMLSEVWVSHNYCAGCANDGHAWQYDAFYAIQDGIDAVAAPGIVHVAPGTYYENIVLKNGVLLLGAGAGQDPSVNSIINGAGSGPVVAAIYVDNTAGVQGFTITNGSASFGGGIYCYGSSPVIANCVIQYNQAINGGGGMYNYYSSPIITGSQFEDNSTVGQGSMSCGGAIYNDHSSPILIQCEFVNNSTTHMGGGVYNAEDSTPILGNCTFVGNIASTQGGGLCNYRTPSSVISCIFLNNMADEGGGVYDYNNASTVITGCSFEGNAATSRGGGASLVGTDVSVINCVFKNNLADSGGGIEHNGSQAIVANCLFIRNSAMQRGGGMYSINWSSPLITNCTFFDNMAAEGAGTYTFWYSSIRETNSIFWGNTTDQIRNGDYGESNVSYCDVLGGYGQAEYHNIDIDPLFVDAADGDFHLQSSSPCVDAGNNAAVPSWLRYDFDNEPRVTDGDMNGVAIVDMGAYETEGVPAIYYDLSTASTVGGHVSSPGEPGPFTYIDGVEVSLVAAQDPGYRFFEWTGDVEMVADVSSASTTITMNGNYTVTALFIVSEAWVDDDYTEAGHDDGHTWGFDAFDRIQDAIDTLPAPGTIYVAPGIYYEHIVLNDGLEILGAGAGDNPDVNSIIDGGAKDTVVRSVDNSSQTKIDGFTITNGCFVGGGGMYICNSSTYIANCTFKSNSASNGFGGAMYTSNSSPVIANCIFQANSADSYDGLGGALYNYGSPTIINCIFINNYVSDRGGGAIFNAAYSSPTIINCSFFGNSAAYGAAIANDSVTSNPKLINCILWGNAPNVIYDPDGSLVVTYSDVQGGYTGSGNINNNPMFENPLLANLELLGDSPCIDAGDNSGVPVWVATDFKGDPRYIDDPYIQDTGEGGWPIVDMGAFEYSSFLPNPTPTPMPSGLTLVSGITREVNGDILPGVSITLDGISPVVSDQSGQYEITATATGSHTVVAHKDGFRDRTQTINAEGLGQAFAMTCNFQGAHGLIPNAPDMWYALDCVNRWLYPPDPETGLDIWTALDVINAWLYPVQ